MNLFDALVRYETALWDFVEGALRDGDAVSLAQLESLRVVHRHAGKARVHEIAQELLITPGAASKLADRLEHAGLIERRPNPDDRRSALLALTTDGKRRHAEAKRIATAALHRHLDGDDIDVEALTATLLTLRGRLQEQTSTPVRKSA